MRSFCIQGRVRPEPAYGCGRYNVTRAAPAMICCVMAGIAALIASGVLSEAAAYSPPKAALIVDANSGRTLYSSNATAPRYPASLTKVMTLYVLFEYLKDGRLDMDTKLTVSAEAASRPPSKVGFKSSDSMTVRAAIRLLVTKSANDVAAAVAENIAGSEEAFAKLMTREARAMGMKDTTFRNASGLPHSAQKTTARDMAILARRVLSDFPQYADAFKRRYVKYRGKTYRNHNRLLFRYKGVIGLKTGFIRASGFNVMIAAQRGKKRLYGVVMGGRSAGARDRRMRKLLDAAWEKASVLAPRMTAHLPERNPAFTPSERERQIRRRLAAAETDGRAFLFNSDVREGEDTSGRDRGSRPSKTQARLSDQRAPERSRPEPQPADKAGLPGPFHVQVGAYVSARDARRRLDAVSGEAGKLLGRQPRTAIQAEIDGKPVFRARFGGFDENRANTTCTALKRRSINCFVVAAR